jgi:hypothetical protein
MTSHRPGRPAKNNPTTTLLQDPPAMILSAPPDGFVFVLWHDGVTIARAVVGHLACQIQSEQTCQALSLMQTHASGQVSAHC